MQVNCRLIKNVNFLFLFLLIFTSQSFPQSEQKFVWDKVAFPVLVINDSALISDFANELLIPLDSTVQKLALVDINFNGPGIKDIIISYPSCNTFKLEFLTDKVKQHIRNWPVPQLHSTTFAHDSLLALIEPHRVRNLPIIRSLHESTFKIYNRQPLKIFFTRKGDQIEFEMVKLDMGTQELWDRVANDTSSTDSDVASRIKIVILGSSTAAGTGPQKIENAWVWRYRKYVQNKNIYYEVINLAKGGYTTYKIMPIAFSPSPKQARPDTLRNITRALQLMPDAIIINLPSNDAASGIPVGEQLANYKLILAEANEQNVPVWIATTQPRNLTEKKRKNLMALRDSTFSRFGPKAIDFWSMLANEDGTILPQFDCGDGVHLNDEGHRLLFQQVVAAQIVETLVKKR